MLNGANLHHPPTLYMDFIRTHLEYAAQVSPSVLFRDYQALKKVQNLQWRL